MSATQNHTATPTAQIAETFMSRDEVLRTLCVCQTTLYAWIGAGFFPSPIALGPCRSTGHARRSLWVRTEVNAWVREQIAKPRPLAPDAEPKARSANHEAA